MVGLSIIGRGGPASRLHWSSHLIAPGREG
jgi:hypothetical protein